MVAGQVLSTVTPHVKVFGRHADKLAIARELALDAGLTEDAPPRSFDVVVDVTGRVEGLAQAIGLVRPRGTVVLKSTFHGHAAFDAWPVVVNEVTLVGSRCGPYAPAIALLASGAVRVEPLVSAVLPLSAYAQAFEVARTSLKAMVDLRAA